MTETFNPERRDERQSVELRYKDGEEEKTIEARVGQTLAIFGKYSPESFWTIEEIMDEPIIYEGTGKKVTGFWLSEVNNGNQLGEPFWYQPTKTSPDGRTLYQGTEDTIMKALIANQQASQL